MRRYWGTLAIVVVLTSLAAGLGWSVTNDHYARFNERALDEVLALVVPGLESEIARFSTLTEVLKEDPRVLATLVHPAAADVAALNTYFEAIAAHTGAGEYSVLGRDGTMIASSSWNRDPSVIGQNFSFRPYFRDAMATGHGRFFAIGLLSGLPGHYIASRVDRDGQAIGIVVVKIDLSGVEASWRRGGADFALVDRAGVVFLSNRPDWKYRPLHALSGEALAAIARDRQYDGIDLRAKAPLFEAVEDRSAPETSLMENGVLFRLRPVGADGWRAIAARRSSGPIGPANAVAFVIMLVGLVVSGGIHIYTQRGLLVRIKSEQSRLLEQRVEERTRELEAEIEIRHRTELSLKDAEHDLVHSAKLAALGQMSAALAHEVSQPITALAAMLTAAERRLEAGEADTAGRLIERAQSLTRRIQHIVRHLRSFARKERGEGVLMRVSTSVEAALELAETRAREIGVDIVVDGRDETAAIYGSPVRFEQVLINLMLNALDAVAGCDRREVGVGIETGEATVTVRVWDSGPGMPAAMGDKLVEPFFTTKPGQDGLGLGLSISQSILADFGAEMRFLPREGGGTVCEIRLPLAVRESAIEAAE